MAEQSVTMNPEKLRPETYFGKLADSITRSPEMVTGFSRSRLFIVGGWVYDWGKNNPKRAHKIFWVVLVFHIWVYGLAFHHLDELEPLMELLRKIFG